MVQAAFARVAAAVVGVLLAWSPPAAGAEPVAAAMRIQDLSQSTRCAEDDNGYVAMSGGDVRRFAIVARTEGRRVGKESVSSCRYGWSPSTYNKNKKHI